MTLRKMGRATINLGKETGKTGLSWGEKGVKLGKKGYKAGKKDVKKAGKKLKRKTAKQKHNRRAEYSPNWHWAKEGEQLYDKNGNFIGELPRNKSTAQILAGEGVDTVYRRKHSKKKPVKRKAVTHKKIKRIKKRVVKRKKK